MADDEPKQNGTGFSLSFGSSKATHRTKRVKVYEDEERPEQQFVTGFAENGAVYQDGNRKTVVVDGTTKKVIPTQGNDFRGMGPRAYNPKRRVLPTSPEAPLTKPVIEQRRTDFVIRPHIA